MKIRESWMRATEQLAHNGVPDASIEAEVLLRHAMDVERADFFAALHHRLDAPDQERVDMSVRRRASGEPLAYILGHREFYGLDIQVDSHVLVPRQETELLVDKVLELAEDETFRAAPNRHGRALLIADVGTGSGAIAVAIAHHLPQAIVYATDSSRQALAVADINRRRHGVSNRVHLRQGDLLEALQAPVDVIVSNPPYIRTDELAGLPIEVRREPSGALDGGHDGLQIIHRLFLQAPRRIRAGGCLLVEIAPQQLEDVSRLGREAFPSAKVSFARDLLGLPRVVCVGL